jgi:hypothetical protein
MLCAVRVRADLTNAREHARQMDSGNLALGAELTTYFGRVEGSKYTLLQPTALAFMRVREVVFEAAAPFTYVHENASSVADSNLFGVGNPWFGLAYLPDTSCGLARLSLGVAPNLADASTPRKQRALALARGAHGGSDAYLFTDRLLPLVLGVGTLRNSGC